MAGFHVSDTMPKHGHVTDLREQWLVRSDGALAHRLQDHEISSHLCENRFRNQQIREDFPVAKNEQMDIERELRMREHERQLQAEADAEVARRMAELNLRRQRERGLAPSAAQPPDPHYNRYLPQPCSSRAAPPAPLPAELNPEELGLSPAELAEMKMRLEQEEKDARLARELSNEDSDGLLADMRCAVEVQDGELARLLQEREYKKLQKAKEKAKQKALLKKQQRLAQQQSADLVQRQPVLCDNYSNPRDILHQNGQRLCKSVDSDIHYVEPFEKEVIESKASALRSLEISRQLYKVPANGSVSNMNSSHAHSKSVDSDKYSASTSSLQHRQPPPPPTAGKKPRFPDPVSIRPASHYPTDNMLPPNDHNNVANNRSHNSNLHSIHNSANNANVNHIPHSYSEDSNMYNSTFPPDHNISPHHRYDRADNTKRLSVISDITPEGLIKKKNKDMQKKRKGCKIQ